MASSQSTGTPQPFAAVDVPPGVETSNASIPSEVSELGRLFRSGMRDRHVYPVPRERAGTCLLFLQRLEARSDFPWIEAVEKEVRDYADFRAPMQSWTRDDLIEFLNKLFQFAWCEDAVSPSVRGGVDSSGIRPGYGQSGPTALLIHTLLGATILQLQDRTLPIESEKKGYYYLNSFSGKDLDLIQVRTPEMGRAHEIERECLLNQPYAEEALLKQRYDVLRQTLIRVIAAMALACGCPPSSSDGPPRLPQKSS